MLPCSSKEVQILVLVLNFITRFATQSDSTNKAVLHVGILDMLVHIYIVFPTLSASTREDNGKIDIARCVSINYPDSWSDSAPERGVINAEASACFSSISSDMHCQIR